MRRLAFFGGLLVACALPLLSQSLPPSLTGTTWKGSASTPGSAPWQVEVTLANQGSEVIYPSLRCTGKLNLLSAAKDGTLQFVFALA